MARVLLAWGESWVLISVYVERWRITSITSLLVSKYWDFPGVGFNDRNGTALRKIFSTNNQMAKYLLTYNC